MFGQSEKGKAGRQKGQGFRLDLTAQQWVVAFLIGTATVFAAAFGWQAIGVAGRAVGRQGTGAPQDPDF